MSAKVDPPERVYDRSTPMREGNVTQSSGMNVYVEWDDGEKSWTHIDGLGHVPQKGD